MLLRDPDNLLFRVPSSGLFDRPASNSTWIIQRANANVPYASGSNRDMVSEKGLSIIVKVLDVRVLLGARPIAKFPGLSNNGANVLEQFYVSYLEFYAEFDFDRDYKIDVIKRVPVRNVFPASLHR